MSFRQSCSSAVLGKAVDPAGAYRGYRDCGREAADKDGVSHNYYDVAIITPSEIGRSAIVDTHPLDAIRSHNLVAFRLAWKCFEEAVPRSVRLVPQAELRSVIERDYRAAQGMILDEAPDCGWITDQLRVAEAEVNGN